MERVLVYGGRRFNDRKFVFDRLDAIHARSPIELLIHGACPNDLDEHGNVVAYSADMLAEEWAKSREIPYIGWPARWRTGKRGKGEGPLRNQRMLDKTRPTMGCEFFGGTGTADMRRRLKRARLPVAA